MCCRACLVRVTRLFVPRFRCRQPPPLPLSLPRPVPILLDHLRLQSLGSVYPYCFEERVLGSLARQPWPNLASHLFPSQAVGCLNCLSVCVAILKTLFQRKSPRCQGPATHDFHTTPWASPGGQLLARKAIRVEWLDECWKTISLVRVDYPTPSPHLSMSLFLWTAHMTPHAQPSRSKLTHTCSNCHLPFPTVDCRCPPALVGLNDPVQRSHDRGRGAVCLCCSTHGALSPRACLHSLLVAHTLGLIHADGCLASLRLLLMPRTRSLATSPSQSAASSCSRLPLSLFASGGSGERVTTHQGASC